MGREGFFRSAFSWHFSLESLPKAAFYPSKSFSLVVTACFFPGASALLLQVYSHFLVEIL